MKKEKQNTANAIAGFLAAKSFAVVGVSASRKKFGNSLFRTMCEQGLTVVPVHRSLESVEERKCYRSIRALGGTVEAVVTVVPPQETERVVQECAEAGIRRIWMTPGSESARAIGMAQEKGIEVVHGECLMMYLEPVRSIHAFHRGVKRLFGGYTPPVAA